MAVIYLKHPRHGYKVESSELIAKMDKDNGWVEYDPAEELSLKAEAVDDGEEKPKGKAKAKPAPIPPFLNGPQS